MKQIFAIFCLIGLFSCNQGEKVHYIEIQTEFGNMKVELYNSTPLHRDNILKLASENYYDDLLFHRVIKGFMIQGGDPDSRNAPAGQMLGGGGPGYTIANEIGAPHFKGTLAAARLGGPGNPRKESSGSQFYVVQGMQITDATLDAMENSKGLKYNPKQREKYKRLGGTPSLDMDYTVFGEVVEGLDVIDKIAAVPKDQSDRPLSDVKMKVRVLN